MKKAVATPRLGIAAIVLFVGLGFHMADSPALAADDSQPQTTADPNIPVDELQLMLRPLTKEQLAVEADGWMKLVQKKVAEISEYEIEVKRKNREIEAAAKEAEQQALEATSAVAEPESDRPPKPPVSPDTVESARSMAESKAEEKEAVVQDIVKLREQRQVLIDRLNIVLAEWEKKGGDAKEYKTWVTSVAGLTADVDVSDFSMLWTTGKGWLMSREGGQRWGKNIASFLIVLLLFWVLSKIVANALKRALAMANATSDLLKTFLISFMRRLVLFTGLLVAISRLEISIGPVLAVVGAAGFVVAFALQGTLSNFASGIMILAYRPFDIGDAVNAGGVAGVVKAMNLVSTVIYTFDNQRVIVPNNSIWGGVITNYTGLPTRRVDLTFGISYSDDMDKAATILEDVVKRHKLVLDDPAPVIKVHELADSSVNLICRPWTKTSDYWTVHWDVTKQVKERFDEAGISIPFPQRDVHVIQEMAAS